MNPKFKFLDGTEYELDSKWVTIPSPEYLELVHKELESLNGGEGGMNLLVSQFNLLAVALMIDSAIRNFKTYGLPPIFVARLVTTILMNNTEELDEPIH